MLKSLEARGSIDIDNFVLTPKGERQARRLRRLYRQGVPQDKPFEAAVGPIATGSNVIQDAALFDRLKKASRKTIGVEMEANAIGFVAEQASNAIRARHPVVAMYRYPRRYQR